MENKPDQTPQQPSQSESTPEREEQHDFAGTDDEGNVQGGGAYGSGYGTGSSGADESETSGTESNRS
ncbi:hypothetical protein [Larkinella ripae]